MLATVLALAGTACDPPPSPSPADVAGRCHVGIIADSLGVGSLPFWGDAFRSRGCTLAFVDAKGGRQTGEGMRIIEFLAAVDALPDVLVVALGTNDSFDPRRFYPKVQRIMTLVPDRPVVWVNVDKPWVETTINLALDLAAERFPNLWVYDWNSLVDEFPQIRLWDDIHLTEGGYWLRAGMIARYVAGR